MFKHSSNRFSSLKKKPLVSTIDTCFWTKYSSRWMVPSPPIPWANADDSFWPRALWRVAYVESKQMKTLVVITATIEILSCVLSDKISQHSQFNGFDRQNTFRGIQIMMVRKFFGVFTTGQDISSDTQPKAVLDWVKYEHNKLLGSWTKYLAGAYKSC